MTGMNGYIYNEKQCVTGISNSNVGTLVIECVAVASVLTLQSLSVYNSEFDASQSDGFVADSNSALSQ